MAPSVKCSSYQSTLEHLLVTSMTRKFGLSGSLVQHAS